jgi:predicted DNA-binding protein
MVNLFQGKRMTRKMTITLEDELIEELGNTARALGKKKTQIVREALQSYLPAMKKSQLAEEWKRANAESIKSYNEMIASQGVFGDNVRMF